MRRSLLFASILAFVALPLLAAAAATGDAACCASACSDTGCCAKGAGVERSVEKLDNGVRITIAASDPESIATIQQRAEACKPGSCPRCPMCAEGVTRTVENTATGVVVTAIATDPGLIERLQAHSMSRHGMHAHRAGASCTMGAEAKAGCCSRGTAASASPI